MYISGDLVKIQILIQRVVKKSPRILEERDYVSCGSKRKSREGGSNQVNSEK